MAGTIIVLVVCLACAAYQVAKSTFVKSFATLIALIWASVPAFGYFELLAGVFIGKGEYSRFPALVPWAQSLSFALIFIVVFAILQTVITLLTRNPVDLGKVPELAGRAVCGVLLGLFGAGLLLAAMAMAPLSHSLPYPRFDPTKPDPRNPNRVLPNADGLATGWFSLLSRGAFRGRTSFEAVHPQFLDQAVLNRFVKRTQVATRPGAIILPSRQQGKEKAVAAWPAPEGLKDHDGNPVAARSGHRLVIVRVGITSDAVRGLPYFRVGFGQLRIIGKEKSLAMNPLAGKGQTIYPAGYMIAEDTVQTRTPAEYLQLTRQHFEGETAVRWIDFVFDVPNELVPVLLEFRQNVVLSLPPMADAEDAPSVVPFVEPSDQPKKEKDTSKDRP